jgi:hypothetical protein
MKLDCDSRIALEIAVSITLFSLIVSSTLMTVIQMDNDLIQTETAIQTGSSLRSHHWNRFLDRGMPASRKDMEIDVVEFLEWFS